MSVMSTKGTRFKPKKGVVVGVDISKGWADFHCKPKGDAARFGKDEVAKAVAWVVEKRPSMVVMEASGGYEDALWAALDQAGVAVAVVNPTNVRRFAQASGQHAKTDRIDAEMVALYGLLMKPRITPRIRNPRLRELLCRRGAIVEHLSAEKNRLQQTKDEAIKQMVRESIHFANQQRKAADAAIAQELASSDVDRRRVEILDSVTGIAATSAGALVILLPELGTISRRKITKLAGLAPFTRDSGKWKGKRFIGHGRAAVRAALYMPTLVATRHNPVIREYYKRLVGAGKPKKVALTACMRKLLTIINAMVAADTMWKQPEPSAEPRPDPVRSSPQNR